MSQYHCIELKIYRKMKYLVIFVLKAVSKRVCETRRSLNAEISSSPHFNLFHVRCVLLPRLLYLPSTVSKSTRTSSQPCARALRCLLYVLLSDCPCSVK